MKTTILAASAASAAAMVLIAGAAYAHHSFAMFDSSQHRLIEGVVSEWNYNNPHSWLIVQAPGADGAMTTWSFEGAAIVHAARQGVNGKSYAKGEHVRIVMHPLSDGRNAGATAASKPGSSDHRSEPMTRKRGSSVMGSMRMRSIAPGAARWPQEICAPSKAGPVGDEQASSRFFEPRTISALVPTSTASMISSDSCGASESTMPAASAPTWPAMQGNI
jgi:hypothetical protein